MFFEMKDDYGSITMGRKFKKSYHHHISVDPASAAYVGAVVLTVVMYKRFGHYLEEGVKTLYRRFRAASEEVEEPRIHRN